MLSLVPNATNFNETTTASAATTAAHGWEWDDILPIFSEFYRPIHGYLSLLVCIFGIFANLLNIVVLTRQVSFYHNNCVISRGSGHRCGSFYIFLDIHLLFPYLLIIFIPFTRSFSRLTPFRSPSCFNLTCHTLCFRFLLSY